MDWLKDQIWIVPVFMLGFACHAVFRMYRPVKQWQDREATGGDELVSTLLDQGLISGGRSEYGYMAWHRLEQKVLEGECELVVVEDKKSKTRTTYWSPDHSNRLVRKLK